MTPGNHKVNAGQRKPIYGTCPGASCVSANYVQTYTRLCQKWEEWQCPNLQREQSWQELCGEYSSEYGSESHTSVQAASGVATEREDIFPLRATPLIALNVRRLTRGMQTGKICQIF